MDHSVYEIAKKPGGRYHGWYLQQLALSDVELIRGIQSFEKQMAKHQRWIENPLSKTADFYSLHPDRQRNLVEWKWPNDIQRQRDSIEILQSILTERAQT